MKSRTRSGYFFDAYHQESDYIEQPFDIPDSSEPDPDDPSDLDDFDFELDDEDWEVFIPDDDELDLEPDLNDFEAGLEPGAWSEGPE